MRGTLPAADAGREHVVERVLELAQDRRLLGLGAGAVIADVVALVVVAVTVATLALRGP